MKVFVPVSEGLIERLGLCLEDLVPFELEYEVLRPGEGFPEGHPAEKAAAKAEAEEEVLEA